jgi:hypothetical protein
MIVAAMRLPNAAGVSPTTEVFIGSYPRLAIWASIRGIESAAPTEGVNRWISSRYAA